MIFRRRRKAELMLDGMGWAELLHLSHMNTLSLANLLLTVIEDPQSVTDDTRMQVVEMVQELEYGVARMEEYIV